MKINDPQGGDNFDPKAVLEEFWWRSTTQCFNLKLLSIQRSFVKVYTFMENPGRGQF
jgi:hypothetical protein